MLCDRCKRFCVSVLTGNLQGEEWHPSSLGYRCTEFVFSDLATTRVLALSGQCGFCTLIHAADKRVRRHGTFVKGGPLQLPSGQITASVFSSYRASGIRPWTFRLEEPYHILEFCFLDPATRHTQAEITPLDITLPEQVQSQIGTVVSAFSGSDSVSALAKQWMSNCLLNHPQCVDRGSEKPLPHRVIDVGERNRDGSWGSPRIIESGGRKGYYMTLSYRWGMLESQFCTTRETLTELMQFLPLWKLPRTIKDAISWCRALGYSYLWVDSLCIIQGDDGDWHNACHDMANIFENSHVGISALQSPHSHAGLFSYRAYDDFSDQFCLRLLDGQLSTVRPTKFSRELPSETYESQMDDRGWIMQERLLSPAVIHFGQRGIYWECKSYTISEAFSNSEVQGEGMLKNILMDIQRPGCTNHSGGHFTAWYMIIMHYSRKHLSFESDRLSAILGLAARFQEMFGTTFVAGIWREDLHRGLLWIVSPYSRKPEGSVQTLPPPVDEVLNGSVNGDMATETISSTFLDDRHSVPELLTGPSWSWLNAIETDLVRFEVEQYPGTHREMHPVGRLESKTDAIFVEVKVNPCPEIHRGAVRGEIKLWGTVVPAEASRSTVKVESELRDDGYRRRRFNLRRKTRSPFEISRSSPRRRTAKVKRRHLVSKAVRPTEEASLPFILDGTSLTCWDCLCLIIADWRFEDSTKGFFNTPDSNTHYDELRCYLILQRVRPPSKNSSALDLGAFKRIGMGGAKVDEVERFFGTSASQKKFLTMV